MHKSLQSADQRNIELEMETILVKNISFLLNSYLIIWLKKWLRL